MDDLIAIIFALLVFLGPILFKVLGSVFEQGNAKPASARMTPQQRQALEDRARRLSREHETQPLEAEVVVEEGHQSVFGASHDLSAEVASSEKLIELRDDQMDAHLHDKFDHSIGSFGGASVSAVQENILGTETEDAAPQENLAAGIAAMLRSPSDMRKAFIIGEILQRPEYD